MQQCVWTRRRTGGGQKEGRRRTGEDRRRKGGGQESARDHLETADRLKSARDHLEREQVGSTCGMKERLTCEHKAHAEVKMEVMK